jgi:hypothetical protein
MKICETSQGYKHMLVFQIGVYDSAAPFFGPSHETVCLGLFLALAMALRFARSTRSHSRTHRSNIPLLLGGAQGTTLILREGEDGGVV